MGSVRADNLAARDFEKIANFDRTVEVNIPDQKGRYFSCIRILDINDIGGQRKKN